MTINQEASSLRIWQHELEENILFAVQNFERKTSMSVHAVKVYRGDRDKNGHRMCKAIEVDAQLR